MPEGPEIRRAADMIAGAIEGETALRVYFGLHPLKRFEATLSKQLVTRVHTHGKAMLIDFTGGQTIFSHNQLYGRWYTAPAGELPVTNRTLRLAIHARGQSALLYSASTIAVLDSNALSQHPFLGKLGPDVLHTTTTAEDIRQRLQSPRFRNRTLGLLLTDQSFVAGLGDYLRCEILFLAGLPPSKKAKACGAEELSRLATLMKRIPQQSYRTAGITNDLQRADKLMHAGATFEQARFHLFRREGKPCYQCGAAIIKIRNGGQSCYHCPCCQRSN